MRKRAKAFMPVGQYFGQAVKQSGISHREIADCMEIKNELAIQLFLDGDAQLPLCMVLPVAKLLGIDPLVFFLRILSDYWLEVSYWYDKCLSATQDRRARTAK